MVDCVRGRRAVFSNTSSLCNWQSVQSGGEVDASTNNASCNSTINGLGQDYSKTVSGCPCLAPSTPLCVCALTSHRPVTMTFTMPLVPSACEPALNMLTHPPRTYLQQDSLASRFQITVTVDAHTTATSTQWASPSDLPHLLQLRTSFLCK